MTSKPLQGSGARSIFMILAILLIMTLFAATASSAPGYIAGDVNGDGVINVKDVVLVMKHTLEMQFPPLTEDQLRAADINGDGVVNVSDAIEIMKISLGLIDSVPMPITSLEDAVVRVPIGTALADINLPATVQAHFAGGVKRSISVRWEQVSTPAYNPFVFDEYIFRGELINLPSGVKNPADLKPRARVSFLLRDPWPFPGPTPEFFTVTFRANPTQGGIVPVDRNLRAGSTIGIEAEANPGYRFNNWSAPAGSFANPSMAVTTFTMPAQNVIVTANFSPAAPVITDVEDLAVITVPIGTGLNDVGLPDEVEVTVTEGTSSYMMDMIVNWNSGSPPYNGNIPGLYIFTGTIVPPLGSNITNPQGLTAEQEVIVFDDQVYEVDDVYPLDDITVSLGTQQGAIPFPSTALVMLDNGWDIRLGVHNWSPAAAVYYDPNTPGTYAFEGSLIMPSGGGITNPLGLKAEVDVIVGPTLLYQLTLLRNPVAGGMVTGGGIFSAGTAVSVSAAPNAGYSFVNWTRGGTVVSTSPNFTYTMPAQNTTLVANFQSAIWPIYMEGPPTIAYIDLVDSYEVTVTIKDAYKDQVTSVTILGQSAVKLSDGKRWRYIFDSEVTLADLIGEIDIQLNTPDWIIDLDQTKAMIGFIAGGDTYIWVYLNPGKEAISVTADGTSLIYNNVEDRWESDGALWNYEAGDIITIVATTADDTETIGLIAEAM